MVSFPQKKAAEEALAAIVRDLPGGST